MTTLLAVLRLTTGRASLSAILDPSCSRAIISTAWELTPRTEAGSTIRHTPFFLSTRFALVERLLYPSTVCVFRSQVGLFFAASLNVCSD